MSTFLLKDFTVELKIGNNCLNSSTLGIKLLRAYSLYDGIFESSILLN
jgi:hypothetical protein